MVRASALIVWDKELRVCGKDAAGRVKRSWF